MFLNLHVILRGLKAWEGRACRWDVTPLWLAARHRDSEAQEKARTLARGGMPELGVVLAGCLEMFCGGQAAATLTGRPVSPKGSSARTGAAGWQGVTGQGPQAQGQKGGGWGMRRKGRGAAGNTSHQCQLHSDGPRT